MRIALLVPGGVGRTGEHRVIPAVIALIERLSARHDVLVFALTQEPAPGTWELAGAAVHNIGARRTTWRALRAIVSEHRLRSFDVVHAIWSGRCGLVAVAFGAMTGVPSVVHVAGGELAALPEIQYGSALRWRGRIREALVLRAASAVTSASDPIIDSLLERGLHGQRVPLGVDLRSWPPREPVRRNPRARARLLHVASLNRVKDQATLLRALVALASAGIDFEMTVVGEDTLGGQIHALTNTLGLADRVTFRGFLPQQLLRPLFECADLMVISSRHETGPVVVLEAAVAGVPTVGTDVGHISEWAPAAAAAVPVGDWQALAEEMRALLTDEDRRFRMAREAFQLGVAENADRTAQDFQALYERLRQFH